MEKDQKNLVDNISSGQKYISSAPLPQAAPEQQNKEFEKIKKKLEVFSKKLIKKFAFTQALSILPSASFALFEEDEELPKEVIASKPLHLMMIMPEEQYKNVSKIKQEIIALVKETEENIWIHIKTSEVDLWNYGLDTKYEFLDAIAASYPLFDTGVLGALRAAVIHKNLCLNWLNTGRVQYIASYGIFGSLVRGTADKTSDVDTFVIIDDTDVKRMSRIELLEKLRRRITYDFIKEATALAGVKNILNVQVYLLTDFWQSVKDAQPVMFTLIRDGIPFFDKGTFTPWKRLLQMGRIKPSPEAIDLYMKEGERTDELIKRRMMDSMVDAYFGVVTPTQAMMMLAGQAPPVPKVIVQEVKKILVDQEKVMSLKDLQTLEKVVKLYKDYEHGKLKEISGAEIDALLKETLNYTKRMKELRAKLEKKMQENQTEKIHDTTIDLMKKIFGNKSQEAILKEIEKDLVKKGKLPKRMLDIAKEMSSLKKKTLSASEIQRTTADSSELNDALIEYAQRRDLINVDKTIMRISLKDKKAEIVLTNSGIFVAISDGQIFKATKNKLVKSDKAELEKALTESNKTISQKFDSEILELIRKELGDFEIIL